MRISTRLNTISLAISLMLSVLLPVLYFSFINLDNAKEDYHITSSIKDGYFERVSLRDQYFIYREERAQIQLDKKKEESDTLLRQAKLQLHNPDDLITLEDLRISVDDTISIFHRIVKNTENIKKHDKNYDTLMELDQRLCSQLLLKSSQARELIIKLQESCNKRAEIYYQRFNIIIGLFSVILSIAIILTSMSINKLIHRRLAPLHQGTAAIANGNLAYRIPCESSDEFSDIINSVNNMTAKLQIFTTQLESEIAGHKKSKEKLQLAASVFSHAREGIIITDADGKIIDVNDAYTRITGYSRDEVIGKNPSLLKSGHQKRDFYQAMWSKLLKHGNWYGEIWNRRKNGELFAVMLTISAISDSLGKVQNYIGLFSDITALKEHEKQLEKIAHYDSLTTLPNRLLLADRLHQAMAQALRSGQRLAVVYLDLDGFKTVNDNHGHEIGDKLLMTVATRMKQCLREGDTLARIGGDEFVAVLLDQSSTSVTAQLLTRLLAAAAQVVEIEDLQLHVSASIGVTFFPQTDDLDADQLLRQADQAMYQAKISGKNCYHFFATEMADIST